MNISMFIFCHAELSYKLKQNLFLSEAAEKLRKGRLLCSHLLGISYALDVFCLLLANFFLTLFAISVFQKFPVIST